MHGISLQMNEPFHPATPSPLSPPALRLTWTCWHCTRRETFLIVEAYHHRKNLHHRHFSLQRRCRVTLGRDRGQRHLCWRHHSILTSMPSKRKFCSAWSSSAAFVWWRENGCPWWQSGLPNHRRRSFASGDILPRTT